VTGYGATQFCTASEEFGPVTLMVRFDLTFTPSHAGTSAGTGGTAKFTWYTEAVGLPARDGLRRRIAGVPGGRITWSSSVSARRSEA
jgi:hypothetical protein